MSWDEHYKLIRNKKPLVWPEVQIIRLVNKLKIDSKKKILDLACGEGRNLRYFLENNLNVTAIEQSEEALKIVKRLYNIDDDKLICSEALTGLKSLDRNSFDLIVCWGLMQYIKEPQILLDEIYKVLSKNSHLIISFNSNKDKRESADTIKNYYDEPLIKKLIENSKLKIIEFGRTDTYFETENKIESFYWYLLQK